jgi:hypothetical protein
MPITPSGFAPVVPNVTNTEGMPPDAVNAAGPPGSPGSMEMLAKMMGSKPGMQGQATVGDKMMQAIQILREVAQSDPRLAMLVGTALQSLIQGPNMAGQAPGASGQAPAVPGASPSTPTGGPV